MALSCVIFSSCGDRVKKIPAGTRPLFVFGRDSWLATLVFVPLDDATALEATFNVFLFLNCSLSLLFLAVHATFFFETLILAPPFLFLHVFCEVSFPSAFVLFAACPKRLHGSIRRPAASSSGPNHSLLRSLKGCALLLVFSVAAFPKHRPIRPRLASPLGN